MDAVERWTGMGVVTKVEAAKGFFFITERGTNASVFAHIKELPRFHRPGNREKVNLSTIVTLGQNVAFDAIATERGLRAIDVRVL